MEHNTELSSPAAVTMTAAATRVSVVVLAYNEEVNLPACLASLRGLACEVFVVDSGSTDRTREIAAAAGAAVVARRRNSQRMSSRP